MLTGAIIGFIVFFVYVLLVITVVMTTNLKYTTQFDPGRAPFTGLIIIGLGASIGYFIS